MISCHQSSCICMETQKRRSLIHNGTWTFFFSISSKIKMSQKITRYFYMREKKKKTHTTKKRNKNKTQSNGDRATRWEQLLQSDAMWHALNSVLLLLIWICLCVVYRKSHSSSWHQMAAQSDNLHFILIAQSFKSQLNYCLAVYIIYSLFVCLFCCNPRWISPYRIVLI